MQKLLSSIAEGRKGMESKYLAELQVGKMNEVGSKLVADKRKGVLLLEKKDDILTFIWKQRKAQENEDQFMLFGDAKWLCIDEEQLVYCLKFDSGNDHFYYVQQFEHEEMMKSVYEQINGDVLENTKSIVSKSPPSTAPSNTVTLSDHFKVDKLKPLLDNPLVVSSVFPLLPSDHTLEETVNSVQFKQSLSSLDQLIQNGHLKDILQQLGIQHSGNESGPSAVEAFLNAIKSKYCDK